MKRNRNSRLVLHRETLYGLEPIRLGQALGVGPDRISVTGCPGPTRLQPCSEGPNAKCWGPDPTNDEACPSD